MYRRRHKRDVHYLFLPPPRPRFPACASARLPLFSLPSSPLHHFARPPAAVEPADARSARPLGFLRPSLVTYHQSPAVLFCPPIATPPETGIAVTCRKHARASFPNRYTFAAPRLARNCAGLRGKFVILAGGTAGLTPSDCPQRIQLSQERKPST